jgi:hypothetical protein
MSRRNPIGEIMRNTRVWICLCLFAVTITASSQAVRKPGLWEMTVTMTWQKSPMPAGMTMPAGMKNPFSGTTTTTQVCLTPEMINKYGIPTSQNQRDCKTINVALHATSMTADMVCSGKMNGKGEMSSSWPDGNVANGNVHFAGTMQSGSNATPVEWTVISKSVYKGPDCGSVKPLPMPQD